MNRIRVNALKQAADQCLDYHEKGERPPERLRRIKAHILDRQPEAAVQAVQELYQTGLLQ